MKKYKKKVIITGALGQDGRILSKIFIKNKFEVIGIVKSAKKKISGIKYYKIPLDNFTLLSKILNKIQPDILIHLGTDNPNFLEQKKYLFNKNYLIVKNILDFFSTYKKKTKIILIGSSQMYNKNNLKINLNTNFKPQNAYARFRVKSYNYMQKIKKKNSIKASMAILFNHDSIHRNKKFLMPRVVNLIKKKNFTTLKKIFNENISGDFSHADDICNGIYKLSNSKYNLDKLILSSNKRTFINDIINYLLDFTNNKIKFNKIKIKKYINPIGNNHFAKKILKWNIKKNSFIAAKELFQSLRR
jgi:GDP-D-mannose dehydratase|tara:strand:+ start:191 stop:1096 length:906 start_codon:yes stop_codon:yes gene_type:complete